MKRRITINPGYHGFSVEEPIIRNKICPNDYNKHHRWERVGCDREMIIYQCHQCRKCAFERIEMLGNLKDV